jgi:hypothetical protein
MFKKFLSLLLIGFLLVSAETVTKAYKFNNLTFKDGYTYLAGCRPSDQGFAPAVSVKASKIMLKPGQQAKKVTVKYGKLVQVPGDFFVKPTIPAYKSDGKPASLSDESIYKDATARALLAQHYEKDALFPGVKETYLFTTQYKCGVPVTITIVHPVQYNPVRGELFYYEDITVAVETEPVDPAKEIAAYVMTPFHRSILQQTVDNTEAIADLELTPRDVDDYEVLVITNPNIQSTFNEYVALNKRRGLRTKVALITDVLQTSGTTDQDKVRNYIKNEFTNHKILFVVLGGDVNVIKVQELYSEAYDHNQTPDRFRQVYSGADIYYATLDGNWNNDGDNKFGEVGEEDLFFEVYVSRMPADNTTDLTNILNKTKHYAETPKRDQVKNVLMAGEFAWDDYGYTVWGADNIALYVGYVDRFGWQTYGWTDDFNLEWITDKETGAENGWDGADLRAKLLSHKPVWIDHQGHGNSSYCFSIGNSQIPGIFSNTGTNQNYFITYSGGCNIQMFSVSDCFMEEMINQPNGAVVVMGNWDSGIGDDDGNNHPSCVPIRHMHDAIFNPARRVHFIEATHAGGKESVIDLATNPNAINIAPYYGLMRYCCYNTNGFGDPALSVWTDTPKDVTATTFNVTGDGNQFTISNVPPYTCVGLADITTDEIFSAQITGYKYNADVSFVVGDSACLINDAAYKTYAAANNKVKVYIKATNYIPGSFEFTLSTDINNYNNSGIVKNYTVQSLRGNTVVNFTLTNNETVNVSLFNVKGALVKTLMNSKVSAGAAQQVSVSNSELSSGLYYCKISTNSSQSVKSVVVAK